MAPQEFYESLLRDTSLFYFPILCSPYFIKGRANIIFCFSYTNFHTKLISITITIIFKNLNLQILLKLNLLLYKIFDSVEQYSSSRNHLSNNPHVKMPSKIGYFPEIITLQ